MRIKIKHTLDKNGKWVKECEVEDDNGLLEDIESLKEKMSEQPQDICDQFEVSWNEIFTLMISSEASEISPRLILGSGHIKFASA